MRCFLEREKILLIFPLFCCGCSGVAMTLIEVTAFKRCVEFRQPFLDLMHIYEGTTSELNLDQIQVVIMAKKRKLVPHQI